MYLQFHAAEISNFNIASETNALVQNGRRQLCNTGFRKETIVNPYAGHAIGFTKINVPT